MPDSGVPHIVVVSSAHPVFDPRIFRKQARSLAKRGWVVTLIAQHDRAMTQDGVRIVPLRAAKNRIGRVLFGSLSAILKAARIRGTCYHLHDPELLIWVPVLKLWTRAPIVYDVHENVAKQILQKSWIPRMVRGGLARVYVLVERFALLFIDRIVLAEDSYAEDYSQRDDTTIIRNYPFLAWASASGSAISRPKGPFTVVYAGAVTEARGAKTLVEAIMRLSSRVEARAILIGGIRSQELKKSLTQLARIAGLEKSVILVGQIPHAEVLAALRRSDVGVAVLHPEPNYLESLPTKLFEYMAAGLPVIASDFPLWRSVIESIGCGILVDPLDPNELAKAITYLCEHPSDGKEMAERGRRAVTESYNWEREAERLVEMYSDLLGLKSERESRLNETGHF